MNNHNYKEINVYRITSKITIFLQLNIITDQFSPYSQIHNMLYATETGILKLPILEDF